MQVERVLCPRDRRTAGAGISHEARMFVAVMRSAGFEFTLRPDGVLVQPGQLVTRTHRRVMEEMFYEVHELLVAEARRPN